MASFGHDFKRKYFPASANKFTPVNHGAYGLHPKCVMDAYHTIVDEDLASPDIFVKMRQPKIYLDALKCTAKLLNCSYKNLALVSSDTTGINDVLRSIPFQKGDTVVMASTTFDSCSKMVNYLSALEELNVVVVDMAFPMLDKSMVGAFRAAFENNKVKLALFDTVCSIPGLKLPYVELTRLCREYNVLSLVDGAHLIGLLPVDLSDDFKPDFYTSNLHKWLYVPRGCAVLYVDPKYHQLIQPMPFIHVYVDPFVELAEEEYEDLFWSKFALEGAKWFPSLACVSEAVSFRNNVCGGEDAIREYCFGLAQKVSQIISLRWLGVQTIENVEKTLTTAMVAAFIPVPEHIVNDFSSFLKYALARLIDEFHTLVPIARHNDRVMIRFCCQVYNELSDYEYALDAVRNCVENYCGTLK